MNLKIRPATLDDVDELAAMNQQLILAENSDNAMSQIELSNRMLRWLRADWSAVLIETGKTVVGYMLFQERHPESHPDETQVYIRQYFVKRSFRGKGIGQTAFQQIREQYFPEGATIVLDVLASNPRGRHFWEKLGFHGFYENLRLEKPGLLQEQIDYYRARAGEYDEWFYRLGRYDHGPESNQQWFDEVKHVMQRLHGIGPQPEILEMACGTGIWTEQLLKIGQKITALDASPEVIAINQNKLKSSQVAYRQVDLFEWMPEQEYDLVFFSFWLSHVPPERLDEFLTTVQRATRPGGHLFIVDSLPAPTSSAQDHAAYEEQSVQHVRKLNDGREFTIYKVFYEAEALRHKLAEFGFEADVQTTENYFIHAHARRTDTP